MIKTLEEIETFDYNTTEVEVCLDKEIICNTIKNIILLEHEGKVVSAPCYALSQKTKEEIEEIRKQTSGRGYPDYYVRNYDEFNSNRILNKDMYSYDHRPFVITTVGKEVVTFTIQKTKDRQFLEASFNDGQGSAKNVKTLKMTDTVTLNIPWIRKQVADKVSKAKDIAGDKNVDQFRKQLIQTWMLDKLLEEAKLENDMIRMQHSNNHTSFIISKLCTIHQRIYITLDNNYKEENFELRRWKVVLGKQYLNKTLTADQVVAILKALYDSGNIKKM